MKIKGEAVRIGYLKSCVERLAELTTLLCRYQELLKVEMNNLELPKRIEESARKKF